MVEYRPMKHSSATARIWGAPLLCIVLALAALPAAKSRAQGSAGLLRIPGHVPAAAWSSQPVAEIAPAEPIDLALALPLRKQAELQRLLQRLYDPKDPLYGHFLAPEAFRDRFAPTEAQYEAVA